MMRGSQAGLTLIELLVSVAILGVVAGTITEAAITGLRTTGATAERLGESSDAQLITSWLTTDVQSAQTVDIGGADTSCGGPVTGAGLPTGPVLRLKWNDAGIAQIIAYVYQDEPGPATSPTSSTSTSTTSTTSVAARQLVRRHCTSDGMTTTVADTQTLARSLARSPRPSVTCGTSIPATTTTAPSTTTTSAPSTTTTMAPLTTTTLPPCRQPVVVTIWLTDASGQPYQISSSTRTS